MGDIIRFSSPSLRDNNQSIIDSGHIDQMRRRLSEGMILPPTEEVTSLLADEHASEPIKDLAEIERISQYLIDQKRYRDNMLFIVGINFGLRVSDLLQLRFSHLINDDLTFKLTFPILEKKTSKTRKVAKNRYITINEAVIEAAILYLENNRCHLSDYMFRCEGNRGINSGKPMTRGSVDRILKEIANTLHIESKVATHTLRKTFGYHQMVMGGNDPRKLLLLQKIFGHSSAMQTLEYIGITQEEIEDAYLGLNLGGKNCYGKFSVIGESNQAI